MIAPHLSPVVILGDTLFLSGQLAFDDQGRISGDAAAQTTRCLQRLEDVLAGHGLNRSAIVKTTIWLSDRADFAVFNAAYAAFFGDWKPARSTVVADLALEDASVEIEAIARVC